MNWATLLAASVLGFLGYAAYTGGDVWPVLWAFPVLILGLAIEEWQVRRIEGRVPDED